jgi:hypothetical protein
MGERSFLLPVIAPQCNAWRYVTGLYRNQRSVSRQPGGSRGFLGAQEMVQYHLETNQGLILPRPMISEKTLTLFWLDIA